MATIARAHLPLATATIGPEKWNSDSNRIIKFNEDVVKRSERSNEVGRYTEVLPHLHEQILEQGNDYGFAYMRATRSVVNRLHETIIDVNEELKAMTKTREAVEKEIDNILKGIMLNDQSVKIRATRPDRESSFDGADDLLKIEKQHLLNLKKGLQTELGKILDQILALGRSRARLSKVAKERSRVLDLIPNTTSSCRNESMTRPHTNLGISRSDYTTMGRPKTPETADPIGPLTPECAAAMNEARDLASESAALRKNAKELVHKSRQLAEAAHKAVNSGLERKLAETVCLSQNLEMGLAENRAAVNRAQKFYDMTNHSFLSNQGPEMYHDNAVGDRLERPLVKTLQRHPGNQLPEAQEIVRASRGLNEALQNTSANVGHLKLGRLLMADDLKDKKVGASVDDAILHHRRSRFSNKWSIGHPLRSYPAFNKFSLRAQPKFMPQLTRAKTTHI